MTRHAITRLFTWAKFIFFDFSRRFGSCQTAGSSSATTVRNVNTKESYFYKTKQHPHDVTITTLRHQLKFRNQRTCKNKRLFARVKE